MEDTKKIEIKNNDKSQLNENESTMAYSNYTFQENSKNLSQNSIMIENNEIPIELKEQIEKKVDAKFEEQYKLLNSEYDEKIEELLNEYEEICNKNEIIKAKYEALEEYLKNYCKRANIDYNELLKKEI